MSLRDLNAATRRRLRWHGWLLALWCIAIGLAASWLLLHAFGVRAPVWRYAMSAVLMYSVGLVAGTWYWLRHFAASVRQDGALGHADKLDQALYDAQQRQSGSGESFLRRGARRIGEGLDWGDLIGSIAELFSFDEAAWLVIVPGLIVLVVGVLLLAPAVPALLADGIVAMLAEIAVQFVFGALIARRVLRPRSADDAFVHIVGKTWLAGVLLVIASAIAGAVLSHVAPGAASIADLFRRG
ncbi:MAG TPA: hypothetical protein VIO33_26315 [Burkholderiaceae bacterium]